MGTVFKLEYETRDYGAAESDQKVTETSAGSVEHNRKEWLDEGKLPTGREPGQPKAAEPASIMATTY